MKFKWLYQNNKENLVLFFSGWACDETPFCTLESENYDVLLIYDYSSLSMPIELRGLFQNYAQVDLLAWSFGVKVAQHLLQDFSAQFRHRVAINGTCLPLDLGQGISRSVVLATLEKLSEKNLRKFQRRILNHKENWKTFEQNSPHQTVENARIELQTLVANFEQMDEGEAFYDKALIGTKDLIFIAQNQINYWQDKLNYQIISQAHFCFYAFRSWDEVIEHSCLQ